MNMKRIRRDVENFTWKPLIPSALLKSGRAMSHSESEALAKRYDYRIDVLEEGRIVTYFAESVDFSKASFVTFAPRLRVVGRSKGERGGEILTFPSHLVVKVTHHLRA
jgi:hypothetical protein